jgi:predicted CopG family antitoxin
MITINVEEKTWEELNKRKKAGESFDEVINRLLKEVSKIK